MKNFFHALLANTGLTHNIVAARSSAFDDGWFVASGEREGFTIIVRARREVPGEQVRSDFSWLTVVSWSYDPNRNGMPNHAYNALMNQFEDAVGSHLEKSGLCVPAVVRTGNGKKEWSYYIRDRETFTAAFNQAMKNKKRFPITLTFYHDPSWQELRNLLRSF